jgi:regulator of sirC expression with transglutaminase-like and TPR domain
MLNKINISNGRQKLIIYVVLATVTLAVYWQVSQFDFINLDDHIYVTLNRHIQSGITLDGFRWAFVTTYAEFWHPLTWLSLMFDYHVHGLNASGYHLTNLILHILSTLLLFWLFNRMTGAIWKSAFVAALFAFHPLHVESVAWVSERKDVLSGFFCMLTLCLYVYYTEKPAIKRYLLVLFSFAGALMSKPIVVTLPFVLLLLDYWPLGRWTKDVSPNRNNSTNRLIGEKIPLIVLTVIVSIVTIGAQNNVGAVPSSELFPLSLRIANALISYVTYLGKIFWPINLAVFYPYVFSIPLWKVLISGIIIIAITAAFFCYIRKQPFLFVGWFWYLGTLIPVIGLIQSGEHAMADRHTYLPSIGIAVMLAWGIPTLIKREETRVKILFPVGTAFLAIMALLAWEQCGYWKNNATLFKHALQVTKNNYLAHDIFAFALFKEGKVKEAIDHCDNAIRINPTHFFAYANRGNAYVKLGQYQQAIDDYNEAIHINPYYTDAYNSRGIAYFKLGQNQQAIDDYNEAILLNPDYANAYFNRGIIYINQGNKNLGCRDAQKACDLGNCELLEAAKGKGYCR